MASPSPLCDLEDVEDRLGRDLSPDEQRKATAVLTDASAVVRSYCRRDFTRATTTGRYRPVGDRVTLPLRPVLAVSGVWAVTSYGTTVYRTPLVVWQWAGGPEVYLGDTSLVINGPWIDWSDSHVWVDVEYTHGYDAVPADIVTVVANMVVKTLSVPGGGLIDMETVGSYNVRYSTITAAGPLGLTDGDRQILNKYRTTVNHSVEMR